MAAQIIASPDGKTLDYQYADGASFFAKVREEENLRGEKVKYALFESMANIERPQDASCDRFDAEEMGHLVAFLIRNFHDDPEFDMRQLLSELTPILNRYGLHWE